MEDKNEKSPESKDNLSNSPTSFASRDRSFSMNSSPTSKKKFPIFEEKNLRQLRHSLSNEDVIETPPKIIPPLSNIDNSSSNNNNNNSIPNNQTPQRKLSASFQRNTSKFRLPYMASLGILPQSSLLHTLLNTNPTLDFSKIKEFVQNDILPDEQRPLVWEILLNSVGKIREIWNFCSQQKKEEYEFLEKFRDLIWEDIEKKVEMQLDRNVVHCIAVSYLVKKYYCNFKNQNWKKVNFDLMLKILQIARIFSGVFRDLPQYRTFFAFHNFLEIEFFNKKGDCKILLELLQKESNNLLEFFKKNDILIKDVFLFICDFENLSISKIRIIWDRRLAFLGQNFLEFFCFLILKKNSEQLLKAKDFLDVKKIIVKGYSDWEVSQLLSKASSLCKAHDKIK